MGFLNAVVINTWIQSLSSYKNIAAGAIKYGPGFMVYGQQVRPTINGLKFVSRTCGVLTVASWGYGLYSDFKRYEGADQWKAAVITTIETIAVVGFGLFLGTTTLPALLAIGAGSLVALGIKIIGNKVRDSLLESSIRRFIFYVINRYRKEEPYKYI